MRRRRWSRIVEVFDEVLPFLVGVVAVVAVLVVIGAARTEPELPPEPAAGKPPAYNGDEVAEVVFPEMVKVVIAGMPDAMTWCLGGTRYLAQSPYGADVIPVITATADRTCVTEGP